LPRVHLITAGPKAMLPRFTSKRFDCQVLDLARFIKEEVKPSLDDFLVMKIDIGMIFELSPVEAISSIHCVHLTLFRFRGDCLACRGL
jgi:hypothetical protein